MDNFHLYDEVGRGRQSIVYKGRRKRTVAFVAIKSVEKAAMPTVRHEVFHLHRLPRHPHVLRFHTWYETSRHLWLVLEFAAGRDLAALLAADKRLPEATVRWFAYEVLLGLHHIHAHGALVRALRPRAILLDEFGQVKLHEFQTASLVPTREDPHPHGARHASPLHRAPELLFRDGVPSFASDLWAAGCLFFELLTGSPPFLPASDDEGRAATRDPRRLRLDSDDDHTDDENDAEEEREEGGDVRGTRSGDEGGARRRAARPVEPSDAEDAAWIRTQGDLDALGRAILSAAPQWPPTVSEEWVRAQTDRAAARRPSAPASETRGAAALATSPSAKHAESFSPGRSGGGPRGRGRGSESEKRGGGGGGGGRGGGGGGGGRGGRGAMRPDADDPLLSTAAIAAIFEASSPASSKPSPTRDRGVAHGGGRRAGDELKSTAEGGGGRGGSAAATTATTTLSASASASASASPWVLDPFAVEEAAFSGAGISPLFKDLLMGLLEREPGRRLTWEEVAHHPVWAGLPRTLVEQVAHVPLPAQPVWDAWLEGRRPVDARGL